MTFGEARFIYREDCLRGEEKGADMSKTKISIIKRGGPVEDCLALCHRCIMKVT
jgi:hypothetical protein